MNKRIRNFLILAACGAVPFALFGLGYCDPNTFGAYWFVLTIVSTILYTKEQVEKKRVGA